MKQAGRESAWVTSSRRTHRGFTRAALLSKDENKAVIEAGKRAIQLIGRNSVLEAAGKPKNDSEKADAVGLELFKVLDFKFKRLEGTKDIFTKDVESAFKDLGFNGELMKDGKITPDAQEFYDFIQAWRKGEVKITARVHRGSLKADEWPMSLGEFIDWRIGMNVEEIQKKKSHGTDLEKVLLSYAEKMQACNYTLVDVREELQKGIAFKQAQQAGKQGSLFSEDAEAMPQKKKPEEWPKYKQGELFPE